MGRAAMVVAMAAVFGLGVLAGVGLALPAGQASQAHQALRRAGQARAESVFVAHWQRIVEQVQPLAQPLTACQACIQAAACADRGCALVRTDCAAACGLE